MKLLIAFDGSEHAKGAIRDLRRSGIPRGASAVVLTVAEVTAVSTDPPAVDPQLSRRVSSAVKVARADATDKLREASALSQEGCSLVKELFPTWEVESDFRAGQPGHIIVSGATERRVDLVVVGARGRSALGRLLLGSVSQYVATRATASVVVARHVMTRGDAPVRIVVGIDGSPSARAAVDAVAARAWPPRTEVRVTGVAATHRPTSTAKRVPTAAAWVDDSNSARREAAGALLEYSLRVLTATGLQVSGEVHEGTAPTVLSRHAAELDADCIFVGGQSLASDVGPTAAEDVINSLVTSAPCSVEVVR